VQEYSVISLSTLRERGFVFNVVYNKMHVTACLAWQLCVVWCLDLLLAVYQLAKPKSTLKVG
jgi:hypothetical protein